MGSQCSQFEQLSKGVNPKVIGPNGNICSEGTYAEDDSTTWFIVLKSCQENQEAAAIGAAIGVVALNFIPGVGEVADGAEAGELAAEGAEAVEATTEGAEAADLGSNLTFNAAFDIAEATGAALPEASEVFLAATSSVAEVVTTTAEAVTETVSTLADTFFNPAFDISEASLEDAEAFDVAAEVPTETLDLEEAGVEEGAEEEGEAEEEADPPKTKSKRWSTRAAQAALAAGVGYSIATDHYAQMYCENIGDTFKGNSQSEWMVKNEVETTCHYADMTPGFNTEVSGGCCNGNCAIVGNRWSCKRRAFFGDPLVCCLNDYNCSKSNEDDCFQTPARGRTCPPQYRDLSQPQCYQRLEPYCTGERFFYGQESWLQVWLPDSEVPTNKLMELSKKVTRTGQIANAKFGGDSISARGKKYPKNVKQPCLKAITRAVMGSSDGVANSPACNFDDLNKLEVITSNVNSKGFIWAQNLMTKVFKKYNQESGGLLGGIDSDGYTTDSSFYNTLWDICQKIPGICLPGIKDMCSSYTVDELLNSPDAVKWCGCYLPEEEYSQWQKYGISKECSPPCNRTGVVPIMNNEMTPQVCLQSVCVIDNVNISITDSTSVGGVNFNQLCSSCGLNNIKEKYGVYSSVQNLETTYGIYPPEGVLGDILGSGYTTQLGEKLFFMEPVNWPTGTGVDSNPSSWTNPENSPPLCSIQLRTNASGETGIVAVKMIQGTGNTQVLAMATKNCNTTNWGTELINYFDQTCLVQFKYYNDGTTTGYIAKEVPSTVTPAKSLLTAPGSGDSPGVTKNFVSNNSNRYSYSDITVNSSTCNCILGGFNLEAANSTLPGINLNQECGDTNCFNDQGDRVACGSSSTGPTGSDISSVPTIPSYNDITRETVYEQEREKYSRIAYIMLGVVIFLIITFVISSVIKLKKLIVI